jgi:hypothetical protein
MLVLGYKDKEKDKGIKPTRFKTEDVVSHNVYKHKNKEELVAMFKGKYPASDFDYSKLVTGPINKKLNSTFFEEMGKSVDLYIKKYLEINK